MSIGITTVLTNVAKRKTGENAINGSAFKVTHFEVGTGGVDPGSGSVLAPSPSVQTLVAPIGGLVVVSSADIVGFCPIWTCIVTGISGELSEVGLWAQVVDTLDGVDITFVPGSYFLYSYGTFGRHDVMSSESITFLINTQY